MLILTVFVWSQGMSAQTAEASRYNIIPKPARIETAKGTFIFSPKTVARYLIADEKNVQSALTLLEEITGIPMKLASKEQSPDANTISFAPTTDERLGDEGYMLEVTPEEITIQAGKPAGWFYAVQTLLQLLPAEVYSKKEKSPWRNHWEFPCVSIVDTPRFRWRGMHLDVSRHFFPVNDIYTYLDMLAMHKLNVFHWHLTDDQGWRIEIKKYPRLTEIGAWRVDRENQHWNSREPQRAGEKATYGGYYTQEEIKRVVKYAADHNITIVPEIEMPAHTTAALAAYPQFSCTGGPFTVPPGGVWPITDIYCAGNDSTFYFLQDVLAEVMELFPGQFIHVGGDEADKKEWKACPKCRARIKQEGLKDETELQSYFIKRIERFITSHGRRLIGWDEILEGGLAPEATVMSWRGEAGGIAAARQNHDVVMTPGSHCYFDYYQGLPDMEPLAIGGYTPLSKVYSYEPVPESLSAEEARHVLGAQANLWTEYNPVFEHAQYMTLPRMAAMAEVLWSPKERRVWDDFSRRVELQLMRYEEAGYNYSKSAYSVSVTVMPDTISKRVTVSMGTEMTTPVIRYTLDGTEPKNSSQRYEQPFTIDKTCVIRAGAFVERNLRGNIGERKVLFHKAILADVKLTYPFERYGTNRTLTDGLRGTLSFNDGNWQGYHQNDVEAVIDLGKSTTISSITTTFLQNTASWIFFPVSVEYSVGNDISTFVAAGSQDIPVAGKDEATSIKEIQQDTINMTGRFLRIRAKNVGVCPEWHPGRGEKAWLFIDEIVVE